MARVARRSWEKCAWLLVALTFFCWGALPARAAGLQALKMGTGGKTGVYYSLGQALAEKVNKRLARKGYVIEVVSTGGSVGNVQGLQSGDFALALVQSDAMCKAWAGSGPWNKSGRQGNIRSVAALLSEAVNLLCAATAPIECAADLRGKRVAIGAENSGTRLNAMDVLACNGLKPGDLALAAEVPSDQAAKMLMKGDLDAMFMTIGHPNLLLYRTTLGPQKVRFVPLTKSLAECAGSQKYFETSIPAKYYRNAECDMDSTPTLGVRAVLAANKDLPPEVATALCEVLYGQWTELTDIHFTLFGLSPTKMQKGLCAPLHPAVKAYLAKDRY